MHKRVIKYCQSKKQRFPQYFTGKDVLDCGALDINGNNRYLFENCRYTGIDIVSGKNVDIVTPVHRFSPGRLYDVVISTEMLEHDSEYVASIRRMFDLTKCGGLILLTAGGYGRPEHGTTECHPDNSPLTHNYYKNITIEMLLEALTPEDFILFEISCIKDDIRFVGIKK
jgi:hypothetical protein